MGAFDSKYGFRSDSTAFPKSLVEELERDLGFKLASDYLTFLERWNGGAFDRSVLFPLQDTVCPDDDDFDADYDAGRVNEFYGFTDSSSLFDLRNSNDAYGFREAVPEGYLAVGGDTSFERVCISSTGEVFWWDPGEPWVKGKTIKFLRPAAHDFATFWNSLFVLNE